MSQDEILALFGSSRNKGIFEQERARALLEQADQNGINSSVISELAAVSFEMRKATFVQEINYLFDYMKNQVELFSATPVLAGRLKEIYESSIGKKEEVLRKYPTASRKWFATKGDEAVLYMLNRASLMSKLIAKKELEKTYKESKSRLTNVTGFAYVVKVVSSNKAPLWKQAAYGVVGVSILIFAVLSIVGIPWAWHWINVYKNYDQVRQQRTDNIKFLKEKYNEFLTKPALGLTDFNIILNPDVTADLVQQFLREQPPEIIIVN